jgi:probable rRNA maturation factor
LSKEGFKNLREITVCFVSDAQIKKLNKSFHHRDAPTDVLSFDNSDIKSRGLLRADIVISADTAERNAKIYKTSIPFELNLYVAHGLLHLLGYNDHSKKETILIRKKEAKYVHQ